MREHRDDVRDLKNELKTLRTELKLLEKYKSQQGKIDQSIKETQALLDTLTSSVLEPIVILDWQGNTLYANSAAYNLVDLDPASDFSVLNVFKYVAPDDHTRATENLSRIQKDYEGAVRVYKIKTSTGRTRWVETLGNKIIFRGQEANLVTIRDVTERKRTEDGLRERQAKLDSLFRAVPTGIGIVSDRTLIDINEHICKMTGYSREELLGNTSALLYPTKADYTFVGEERNRQIKEGGICTLETMWKRKDGTIIDVSLIFSPLVPESLDAGITFTALDITKRKKLDRDLKESEEHYRRITSTLTDYIFTAVVENGRTVRTVHSPACEVITGYTSGEFDSDPYLWLNMVHEDDRAMVLEHINEVLSNSDAPPIEHRIRRKDGALRWVSNTPVIHRDSSGTMISYDGVISDITARKLAEEDLRESEVRFRTLLEASSVGICIHYKGIILDCNQGMCEMSGFSLQELIGQDGLKLVSPKRHELVRENFLSETEKPYDVEGIRKDGTVYPLEIRGKSIPYNGRLVKVSELRDITERKEIEEALRKSEERFKGIASNLPGVVYQFYAHENGDMGLSYMSDRSMEILGLENTLQDFYERGIDFIAPEDRRKFFSSIRKAISSFSGWDCEFRFTKPDDGKEIYIRGLSQPTRLDHEVVFNGVLLDVTDRKKAEIGLRESREFYHSMFENNNAVMLLIDPKTLRIVDANPAACSYYGYQRKEFKRMTIAKINTRTPDQIRADIERARTNGDFHFIVKHRLANDELRDVEIYAALIETGGKVHLYSIVHDITERKQAEEALRRNEERFRSMIQNSSDIIVLLNEQGVFSYETPSVSRILGYEPDYLIGKTPADFIHKEDLEKTITDLREVYINTNDGLPTEMRLRKADGSWAHLEAIGKNLLDFPGINGIVITARDITDRKKAERERIEMERRFQHAQKLESLGVLAGGIAHDFNNLLMAILGNLDLALLDLPASSKSHRFISQSRSAAHRAADLTNQMLAYSGKGKFDVKSFDLSEFVEQMARLLKASISKTVTLNLQMDRSLPPMVADPGQIQQIIMNLIVNASEAIGEKAGIVTVATGVMDCDEACLEQSRLKEKARPGSYIYIEVNDTGCGMDEATKERLFDPFFSTKFTGRGLGMSAVLGIVKGHKGAIMVKSEPGMGTSIRVLFPAPDETDAEPLEVVEDLSPAGEVKEVNAHPGSGTVLIVDDEEMVLELCRNMVEIMGFSVLTAPDGKEALAVFNKHREEIACVILDLTMPRMDGIAAFNALKGVKRDVRVIISSGYSVDEVATRFQGSEPAGFIKKPFEFKTLEREINRVVKKSS